MRLTEAAVGRHRNQTGMCNGSGTTVPTAAATVAATAATAAAKSVGFDAKAAVVAADGVDGDAVEAASPGSMKTSFHVIGGEVRQQTANVDRIAA
ncbi:hypothetical protein Pelo_18643 [Pelomyxa schiedti]|nr:hypothetical protein Pelo_18643 [Pelomyxa schiedti]